VRVFGPLTELIAAGFIAEEQAVPNYTTATRKITTGICTGSLSRHKDGSVCANWVPLIEVARHNVGFQAAMHRVLDPKATLPDFSLPAASAHSEPKRFTEEEAVEEFVCMHKQSSHKVRRLGVGNILGRTVSNEEAIAWHQSASDADRWRMIRIGMELYYASKGNAAPTGRTSPPRPCKHNTSSVRNLIAIARRRDDDGRAEA